MELVAQGTGNIFSALFGGIPATGAIARTAANIKNGGRTPVAGMVHAVVLLIVLVVLMPYAALIPMPAIAAILFVVAYNMSEWRQFVSLLKTAPKSDIIVLLVTFVLTVVAGIYPHCRKMCFSALRRNADKLLHTQHHIITISVCPAELRNFISRKNPHIAVFYIYFLS